MENPWLEVVFLRNYLEILQETTSSGNYRERFSNFMGESSCKTLTTAHGGRLDRPQPAVMGYDMRASMFPFTYGEP